MISVFMPIYNGERYLAKTLDSLQKQEYGDFEVLCVNDASTDNSLHILEKYRDIDSRIKIFTKPNEGSVPFSWKYIIPKLNGEFTFYMSQDDLLESDVLKKLISRQQKTNADAVIPQVVFYEEGKEPLRIDAGVNGNVDVILSGKEAYRLALDYTIPGFALWRTEIIRKEGILTDAYNSDELAQRLWMLQCKKVVFSEGRFLYRQDNPNAITKKFSKNHFTAIITNLHLLDSMYEQQLEENVINKYRYDYFYSLRHIKAMYYIHKKEYSAADKVAINEMIKHAYSILSKKVPTFDMLSKISSSHYCFFYMISFLFSMKIRKMMN